MSIFYKITGRKYLYLIFDATIIIISYPAAFIIRFYPGELMDHLHLLDFKHFVLFLICFIVPFYFFQVYRIMWAYSNIKDIYRLIIANIFGFLFFAFSTIILQMTYSRLVIIMSFLFLSIMIIFYRVMLRDYFSRSGTKINGYMSDGIIPSVKKSEKKILIIGAGEAGRRILSEYSKSGLDKQIIGFVDDDRHKIGKIFNGKMIISNTKNINDVISEYKVDHLIIAMPSVNSEHINRIVSIIKRDNNDIPIKILPPLMEMFGNRPLVPALRDIGIIDLIGREEFKINIPEIEQYFSGKTVLVTGGGGSIGSEICKQLLNFKISKLVAIGRGELSIYNLAKSLNEHMKFLEKKPEIILHIADVKDSSLLNKIFEENKPDVVFHAAAHKHVPLMEYNEIEAIQNNVIGTMNVLEVSSMHNIKEFILISTDKAVQPVNIMGATKRMAELVTSYYCNQKGLKTTIVRFGNVIGSSGSVIPLFREQIQKGGPVTVTHPDIKRFFMSIPEASLLVINASAFSNGGEIFVLDMGNQYKIVDIAKNLIRLCGYEPEKDIKIEFTGLRPGEKLYEELFYKDEEIKITANEKISVVNTYTNGENNTRISEFIENVLPNLYQYNVRELRDQIKHVIPEYDYNDFSDFKNQFGKMVN